MPPQIISKTQTYRHDGVVVPRQEYQAFKRWYKTVRVHLDESWFWSPEWQKKEREADKAIRAGKVSKKFSSHRELIKALNAK